MSNYDSFPRKELIAELQTWELKFNEKLKSTEEELRQESNREKQRYKNLCFSKENQALEDLKQDITESIKEFLNLPPESKNLTSWQIGNMLDEQKRQTMRHYGSWMFQRICNKIEKPLEQVHYELLSKLLGEEDNDSLCNKK